MHTILIIIYGICNGQLALVFISDGMLVLLCVDLPPDQISSAIFRSCRAYAFRSFCLRPIVVGACNLLGLM